jgi:ParB-like chromosome segregation protein Spo0J
VITRHLQVEWVPLESLKPNPENPNTHPAHQLRTIARSIARFGFTNPLLVDDKGGIIAGHGRYEGSKRAGLSTVPVIRLSGLSETERRALMIADNRIAEKSVWDPDLLKVELQKLVDVQFDMADLGFDMAEVDLCLGHDGDGSKADEADEVELPDRSRPAFTRPGDLYRLGPHRLICGDARDQHVHERVLQGELAQMVFTDPPYNVAINGHVMGRGKVHHEEFAMASGEMSQDEFTAFLRV